MNEYYWQDMVSGLVTKTTTARKPSRLHKRITKSVYEAVGGLTKRAADVTTCAEIGWHNWHNGVCLRCGEREYNPSRG